MVAPSLFVTTDAQAAAIDAAARSGSSVLVTDQTGIVDENLRARLGGYLGELQSTLGVWIEEFAPLTGAWARPGGIPVAESATIAPTVAVRGAVFPGGVSTGAEWTEALHLHDARVEAVFEGGTLDGWPALTRKARGDGAAWYLATRLDREGRAALVERLIAESGVCVERPLAGDGRGPVESVRRGDLLFLINHGSGPVMIDADGTDVLSGGSARGMTLGQHDVAVVALASVSDEPSPTRAPRVGAPAQSA